MAARLLSASDLSVHLSKQTAKGSINATPAFDAFRRTEGKARENTSYVQSAEVKTSRQARQNVKDSVGFGAELSFEATEQTVPYLQDGIQGTEVATTSTGTGFAADANGFTDTANGFSAITVGDYVWFSGFADTSINRAYYVSVVNSSGDIETVPAPPATEVAGASVTFTSNKTASGSTIPYYTIQTRAEDTSKTADTDYQTYVDGQFNNLSIEVGETGIITGSFGMMAESKDSQSDTGAAISGQTDNSADTSEVLSAINDVVRVWVDGADSVCTVKSMGFEFSNNIQEDRAAGCEGSEFSQGDMSLSGSLNVRLPVSASMAWRDRYNNGTNVALAIELQHSSTKSTIIEVPQAIITEHDIPTASGAVSNSEMTYTAEEDVTRGYTCAIFRNWT